MIIRWLEPAKYDVKALRQYISKDNPSAANRVAKKIVSSVNLLLNQPGLGRQGRILGTRELIVSDMPYIVPYRVKDNVIEIMRVIHSARQWSHELFTVT
jgi:toxin ParE1/3/4